MFKDDLEILPGTVLKSLVTAAPAAYAGYQAINANIKYGQEVDKIESLLENRQSITNPYKDLENPYKNLPVATQAARFQAENADIALANTLDTLRATGAAAGGATALAQAALQSQQGISASLEKQEAQNARLRAQGQLQVDMAKAKGEGFRMRLQESRDVRDVNRIQRQADIFKATEIANKRAVFDQLGSAAEQFTSGIVPAKKSEQPQIQSGLSDDPGITSGTSETISPTVNNQTGAQVTGLDPNQSQLGSLMQTQQDLDNLITTGPTLDLNISPSLPTNNFEMDDLNLGQAVNLGPAINSGVTATPSIKTKISVDDMDELNRLAKLYPNASMREIYELAGLDPNQYGIK